MLSCMIRTTFVEAGLSTDREAGKGINNTRLRRLDYCRGQKHKRRHFHRLGQWPKPGEFNVAADNSR